jgi:hypothetical protein
LYLASPFEREVEQIDFYSFSPDSLYLERISCSVVKYIYCLYYHWHYARFTFISFGHVELTTSNADDICAKRFSKENKAVLYSN